MDRRRLSGVMPLDLGQFARIHRVFPRASPHVQSGIDVAGPHRAQAADAHFNSTSTKLIGAVPSLTTLCSTPSLRR